MISVPTRYCSRLHALPDDEPYTDGQRERGTEAEESIANGGAFSRPKFSVSVFEAGIRPDGEGRGGTPSRSSAGWDLVSFR